MALYDEYMALFAEIGIEIVPGEMIWFEGITAVTSSSISCKKAPNPHHRS
ncbi:MAG: hypothetical protein M5U34_43250 [Chloroflexi bacterium]|nr:hypothetical protein [Chloroflexota bacterium]